MTSRRGDGKVVKLLAAVALVTAAGCSLDVTSVRQGSIRFLAVVGSHGPGQRLVEYMAPPLAERRSMAVYDSIGTVVPLLRDGMAGGFYAYAYNGVSPGGTWRLVRYDADWNVAASRTAAEIADTAALGFPPALTLTADGRFLVAEIWTQPGYSRSVLVLDPVTLVRIHRLPLPPSYFLFPPDGPTAASGTWVLVTSPNAGECPVSFEWLDVETGLTADSATMSCEYVLKGAVTHRQVYRRGPYAVPSARNQLYDVSADAVLATGDSVSPVYLSYPFPIRGRLVWFEAGSAAVTDASTLKVLGRVATGGVSGWSRTVVNAAPDVADGVLIGAAADPPNSPVPIPMPDGIVIIDPIRLVLIVDSRLGTYTQVVP